MLNAVKITTFDNIVPGDMLRLHPNANASCLILSINSRDVEASVTWLLCFDTTELKEDFLCSNETLVHRSTWKTKDRVNNDYWVIIL